MALVTLRRLRKPNDLLRLLDNVLPVGNRESLPPSSSWCLLVSFRFLMRGGVRKARIGDDLRALECWPTDFNVLTEGDNELDRSPSTCIAAFSDGNVASKLEADLLAAFSSKSIKVNSRADSDWLRR